MTFANAAWKTFNRPSLQMSISDLRSVREYLSQSCADEKEVLKVAHAVSGIKVRYACVRVVYAHLFCLRQLDDWKTTDDIKEFDDIAVGDFVVFDDWFGQIQEVRLDRGLCSLWVLIPA